MTDEINNVFNLSPFRNTPLIESEIATLMERIARYVRDGEIDGKAGLDIYKTAARIMGRLRNAQFICTRCYTPYHKDIFTCVSPDCGHAVIPVERDE